MNKLFKADVWLKTPHFFFHTLFPSLQRSQSYNDKRFIWWYTINVLSQHFQSGNFSLFKQIDDWLNPTLADSSFH